MRSLVSVGIRLALAIGVGFLFSRLVITSSRQTSPGDEFPLQAITPLAPEAAPVLAPVAPVVLEHGPRSKKSVALTFDACSTAEPSHYDERITQILIRSNTPATLFLGGKWMKEQPEHTRLLASNPLFELANHTFHHPHLTRLSDDSIRNEINETQAVMVSLTGKRATLFRAPYGEWNERVVAVAASLGLKTVQFDLASGDPDPAVGSSRLIEYVSSMARNGSIIVMHINRRGWHTADALPEILRRLRLRGFTFMTVTDLMTQPTQQ